MKLNRLLVISSPVALLALLLAPPAVAAPSPPQGTQSNGAYAASGAANGVTNTFATSQRVSCFRPEVNYFANAGPSNGYDGMTPCPGATTGEDTGAATPYATQAGSNP